MNITGIMGLATTGLLLEFTLRIEESGLESHMRHMMAMNLFT